MQGKELDFSLSFGVGGWEGTKCMYVLISSLRLNGWHLFPLIFQIVVMEGHEKQSKSRAL